jgi:hypothetical protein
MATKRVRSQPAPHIYEKTIADWWKQFNHTQKNHILQLVA